ncbi:MAG TPA: hypothetical protein VFW30_13830 [Bryocella sp.]|nr:hypothetical protein [Bryocella sp.]
MNASALVSVFKSGVRLLAYSGCFCLVWTVAGAQAPAASSDYTAGLPSAQRIESEIKGTDPTDTLARQIAVFEYLQFYVGNIKYARTVRGQFADRTRPASRGS